MKPPGDPPGDAVVWPPARLRARLAALRGVAPAPLCHLVWRATSRPNAPEVSGYELPGHPDRSGEPEFERWLLEQGLAGPERLSVSVLVIRERLDEAGLVLDCVLERRRGAVEGPYHGNVARVECTGAARVVRRSRALRDGRLAALPDQDPPPPPRHAEPETDGLAAEDDAVRAYLGADATILERRSASTLEDRFGLSVIVHARRADGVAVACGVGWHGGTPFVIAADFPPHRVTLVLPPGLEVVVAEEIHLRDLIRYETRRDELGFCVIARERGEPSLVVIRLDGNTTRIEPYVPGRSRLANADQRRWMTYAETYEARTILDSWSNGENGELVVLTVDPDLEAWRHVIDADGVEIGRQCGNEAGAAALYRELFVPPPASANASPPARTPSAVEQLAFDDEAPEGSLARKILSWTRVTAGFASVSEGGGESELVPSSMSGRLSALVAPLTELTAGFSVGSLHRLIDRARAGTMTREAFATALEDLAARLRDELGMTRIVVLPRDRVPAGGEPRFGALVELHFPAAAYDIEEAIQCLALRRPTAAVLHAAKVLRDGLLGFERLLATPTPPEPTWSYLIATARAVLGDRHDLMDALTQLRQAWRGPDLTPADKYTEAEAEAVLAAAASFMRALAASLAKNRLGPGGRVASNGSEPRS